MGSIFTFLWRSFGGHSGSRPGFDLVRPKKHADWTRFFTEVSPPALPFFRHFSGKGRPMESPFQGKGEAIYWDFRWFIPKRRAVIEEWDLIRRILSGDKDLYTQLVERHGTYLFQLCLALLGDSHQAEEA